MAGLVVLTTGANRGIGAAIVQGLASRAAANVTIMVASRKLAAADLAVKELQRSDSQCSFHPIELDVTSDESIHAAVEQVKSQFGRLDVLINNAGIAVQSSDLSEYRRAFNETLNTNVTSVGFLTTACVPLLLRSQHPQVIMISSGRASMHALTEGTLPPTRVVAYTVSKTAVNVLTLEMRKLHPEIRFQCANPGHCSTGLNGFKGTKDPSDGAQVVVELALADPGTYDEGFWEFSEQGMRQMKW